MLLINVYLPYCCSANYDKYVCYLSELQNLIDDIAIPNVCIIGDFNAGNSNKFGKLLNDFCKEQGYFMSDMQFLPADTFTYISDAHSSTSWLDHCLTSFSVHQAISSMAVQQEYICSDHRPISVTLNYSRLPHLEVLSDSSGNGRRINWSTATKEQINLYEYESRLLFDKISLPKCVVECNDAHCSDTLHKDMIDQIL